MFKIFILLGLLVSSYAGSINVAVAANVSYAIPVIIKEFNKIYPDIKVKTTLGSSGKLTAQISYGAPYDIFLSANMKYPNRLYKKKMATTKPVVYAKGALVLLSKKKQDFNDGLNLLNKKSIKRIAIANAKTAPYGVAAKEALDSIGLYNDLKRKFVYGESISQTILYTLNAADIGIVAKSVLFSSKMKMFKKNINWIDINSKLYTSIKQGIVMLKSSKNSDDAKKFYNFILSKKCKFILKSFGYITK